MSSLILERPRVKRFRLFLSLAVVLSPVSLAFAAQTQTASVGISPKRMSRTAFKPSQLHIVVDVADAGAPGGVPSAPRLTSVRLDSAIKVVPRGIGTCRVAQINGKGTVAAQNACRTALVGSGTGIALLPTGETSHDTFDAEISVFNGPIREGRRTLVFLAYVPAIQFSIPLPGSLRMLSNGGDYGSVLDVTVPPLPWGAALTRFDIFVGRPLRPRFIQARCDDRDRRINISVTGSYANETSLVSKASTLCFPV